MDPMGEGSRAAWLWAPQEGGCGGWGLRHGEDMDKLLVQTGAELREREGKREKPDAPPNPPPQRWGRGGRGALRQAYKSKASRIPGSKLRQREAGTCQESHGTAWAGIKALEAAEITRSGAQPTGPN